MADFALGFLTYGASKAPFITIYSTNMQKAEEEGDKQEYWEQLGKIIYIIVIFEPITEGTLFEGTH